MAHKSDVLIHTALLSEARAVIRHFGLRQFETEPFKVFRNGPVVLIVPGMGEQPTRSGLKWVFARYRISMAISIGIAGCRSTSIPIGRLFRVHGGPESIPAMPIQTVAEPLREPPGGEMVLVDMEAAHFIDAAGKGVAPEGIHALKVVSDHLDDTIPRKEVVESLIAKTIHQWAHLADGYPDKVQSVFDSMPSANLSASDREAIHTASLRFRFSHQEIKTLVEMALDFTMWDQDSIAMLLSRKFVSRKEAYTAVCRHWDRIKNSTKSYRGFAGAPPSGGETKSVVDRDRDHLGFGRCPVASPRTRCCNLLTLDAVEGCGFDCSYCSVRYFYDDQTVSFHRNFLKKLKTLEIDAAKTYHIGTGQSSDSLMWSNRGGVLDGLLDFASDHPNIILELKTKSDTIGHLVNRGVPANVVTTWSLNTPTIITNEEHHTASLERRLDAATSLAECGGLIGFHLHPMVHYDNWERDYGAVIAQVIERFRPEDVVMVSFGTLTFIKPVMKKMRERRMKSRILQMPLDNAEGKYSYPVELKKEMFRFAYRQFDQWHDAVFFYLCMEDASLWPEVFGYDYHDNAAFEADMIQCYRKKIDEKRSSHR